MIKKIFLYLLLGILITWSVISAVLIFHVMGIDQIYTKIRITKDLESIKENRYSRPVMVFKGRLAANSENEINLSAIKSCLEDGVRDELKDLFTQRPYIIVEHASSPMNLECYKTVRSCKIINITTSGA